MEQKISTNPINKWVILVLVLLMSQAGLYYEDVSVGPILRGIFFNNNKQQLTTSPPPPLPPPPPPPPSPPNPQPPCRMTTNGHHVIMDNGLVKVTMSVPSGVIIEIKYKDGRNILDSHLRETQRGYWDLVWSGPGQLQETFLKLRSTSFAVVAQDENKIELSFKNTYHPSRDLNFTRLPLNVDKRFVLLRGESGFYSYAIFERLKGWPGLHLVQIRLTFKLDKRFNYMAISEDKQRLMPTADDLRRGQHLRYVEATVLTNPSNPALKGEVDDKYQYSLSNMDNQVHGWVSTKQRKNGSEYKNQGFWIIMPSYEFKSGGPMKQELTSHTGPTCLADFHSRHYAGRTFEGLKFKNGEAWRKVLGPIFIYLNKKPKNVEPFLLWKDAKVQSTVEIEKWPYNFPSSPHFISTHQRSTVTGRLLINDRFIKIGNFPAKYAHVGLSASGSPGSWQTEAKGYQFWIQTDEEGYFIIKNVQPGNYNLYAWVPGIFGDYKYEFDIQIKPGNVLKLGDLIFKPPRNGPTVWEIGIPDRTAAEFFIPDPAPQLVNYLYLNHTDRYRQYGLWDRYTDLHPNRDLIYNVDNSTYQKDWFFAHVTRRNAKNKYVGTTWQIVFAIKEVIPTATYTLRLALASISLAELQVRVNDELSVDPDFEEKLQERDNAIARHGIHGVYKAISVEIIGKKLLSGTNTIFLTQAKGGSPTRGVMYDYLRLEGPTS